MENHTLMHLPNMKKSLVMLISLFFSSVSFAQSEEFSVYPNGLIYSESTMNKLSVIVDSLNLKYKTCDLNKVFYAKSQTVGHLVRLDKGNIIAAKKDIENQMDLETFLAKYPKATIKKEILVVRFTYINYNDEEVVEFSEINLSSGYGYDIQFTKNLEAYRGELKSPWISEYHKKTEYSEESLAAFYFTKGFTSEPMNTEYSRMIGYADCLIDTTNTKLKDDLKSGWVGLPKNWTTLSQEKQEKLLDEMRSTRVVGMCSMDSRPREHAINIAMLSAETTNWEVFLKAHLDIMNDRFDRMSDGSYAYAQRNTYIKELEVLDINVSDLIFGISLRVQNPAENHYYGSISRVGRALSETQNREEIEQNMLAMIEDSELDDYNRILAYFLFLNYNYYIEDETVKAENVEKLKKSVNLMPNYIKEKIVFDE